MFDEADLCILNTGSPTTVQAPNKNPSAIDVTCVSPDIAPLCEWKVGEDPLGSYHYPTFIDINISPSLYQVNNNTEKYLFNKANWSKYYLDSEKLIHEYDFDPSNPLDSYDKFCDMLNKLKSDCIPLYKRTSQNKTRIPAPWWNDECDRAVEMSKEALMTYRASMTLELFIEYKRCDAKKKLIIKECKRNSWKSLCASLNRYTPISTIWNYIRRFKRINVTNRPKNDEWIPDFIKKLVHTNPCNSKSLDHLFSINNDNEQNKFLLKPFEWSELCTALDTRKDTTPGLDNFPYIMIKRLHVSCKKTLLNILNCLWTNQIIPESWKTQCVIPILKPDKPADDHNSYRPISLASCVGKLMEQMIKLRLDYYVESQNLLPAVQFGFRKGKSASESFVSFIADMKTCSLARSTAVCAFLDVQGAYDNVDLAQLVKVLAGIGLPGKLIKWIYNLSNDRNLYVKYNNILHGPERVFKGLMQGASLSPILYNLYTSEILKYVTGDIKILQFADDILLYSEDRDITVAQNKLNRALEQLNYYYTQILKLNINCSKSSVLVFGSNNSVNIKYGGLNIAQEKEKRFLGIIIDDKLKFDSHINYICKNAMKRINVMRCLAGVFWGSDPKILTIIYKSIVRSQFDYSSLAYINSSPTI